MDTTYRRFKEVLTMFHKSNKLSMYDDVIHRGVPMPIISVRVNQEDDKLIRNYAKLHNLELSRFMRDLAIEHIEDEFDAKMAQEVLENLKEDDLITFEDLAKELGYDL